MNYEIKTIGNRIIFEGHASDIESCNSITQICNTLKDNPKFKCIKYESGYAEFECLEEAEEEKFTSPKAVNANDLDIVKNYIDAGLSGKANASHTQAASTVTGLANVAKSGSYNDLSSKPTIPTVNNSTIIMQSAGTEVGRFGLNDSSGKTINIPTPEINYATDQEVENIFDGASGGGAYDIEVTDNSDGTQSWAVTDAQGGGGSSQGYTLVIQEGHIGSVYKLDILHIDGTVTSYRNDAGTLINRTYTNVVGLIGRSDDTHGYFSVTSNKNVLYTDLVSNSHGIGTHYDNDDGWFTVMVSLLEDTTFTDFSCYGS